MKCHVGNVSFTQTEEHLSLFFSLSVRQHHWMQIQSSQVNYSIWKHFRLMNQTGRSTQRRMTFSELKRVSGQSRSRGGGRSMKGEDCVRFILARLQQHGLEALGSPGRGLGGHWGSEAGEVFRAAHVGGLREERTGVNRGRWDRFWCQTASGWWGTLTFSLPVVQGASLTTKPLDGPRCSSMAAALLPGGLMYAIFASFSTTSAIWQQYASVREQPFIQIIIRIT